MARPSRKQERRGEILDAYGRCIALYGVDGATLERIAEEAGLARALIRHNVGNKQALLDAFLDRFIHEANTESEALFDALPEKNRLPVLIDWLFDPEYSNLDSARVTNALMIAANDRPQLATRLREWTDKFVDQIRDQLLQVDSQCDAETLDAIALGIAATYLNFESYEPLGRTSEFTRSSKKAAMLLISALDVREPGTRQDQ